MRYFYRVSEREQRNIPLQTWLSIGTAVELDTLEIQGVVGLICAIHAWREWWQRDFAATLVSDFAATAGAIRRMRQATREHLAELAERQTISPEGLALLIRNHTGLD